MSEADSELDPATAITIGRVTAPHGVQGELRVELLTDFPGRFAPGARVWLAGAPRLVERFRLGNKTAYLKLAGLDDRSAAEALAGTEIQIPAAAAPLAEGVYHVHDLVGLRVEAGDGAPLGRLTEVLRTGANDVYVVDGDQGRILLPAIEDVVKQIDLSGRRIVVELLPGLEFQAPRVERAKPRLRRVQTPRSG